MHISNRKQVITNIIIKLKLERLSLSVNAYNKRRVDGLATGLLPVIDSFVT